MMFSYFRQQFGINLSQGYSFKMIPGPVDDLVKPFILSEMVGTWGKSFEITVASCDALEKIDC